MISRELSPPVPNAGRSGEIPMLSIPASIRVSVADHTPFDRRGGVTLPYSPPPRGGRGGGLLQKKENSGLGCTPPNPPSVFVVFLGRAVHRGFVPGPPVSVVP